MRRTKEHAPISTDGRETNQNPSNSQLDLDYRPSLDDIRRAHEESLVRWEKDRALNIKLIPGFTPGMYSPK